VGWLGDRNRLLVGADRARSPLVSLTVVAVVASHPGVAARRRWPATARSRRVPESSPERNTTESTLAAEQWSRRAGNGGNTGPVAAEAPRRRTVGHRPSSDSARRRHPAVVAHRKAAHGHRPRRKVGHDLARSSPTSTPYRAAQPNKEGLEALVNLVNAAGGVCGARSTSTTRTTTSTRRARLPGDAKKVFASSPTSSLLDGNDYDSAPLQPEVQRQRQFLPDVRRPRVFDSRSQSSWHGGTSAASRRPWAAGWRSR